MGKGVSMATKSSNLNPLTHYQPLNTLFEMLVYLHDCYLVILLKYSNKESYMDDTYPGYLDNFP